jgi:hypothetical protein
MIRYSSILLVSFRRTDSLDDELSRSSDSIPPDSRDYMIQYSIQSTEVHRPNDRQAGMNVRCFTDRLERSDDEEREYRDICPLRKVKPTQNVTPFGECAHTTHVVLPKMQCRLAFDIGSQSLSTGYRMLTALSFFNQIRIPMTKREVQSPCY